MELVYSIDFKNSSKASEIIDHKICSSLSCGNILAFSRIGRVNSCSNNNSNSKENPNER